MKHAKKMIFFGKKGYVPEAEIAYIDPLKQEHIETSSKIREILKNPKLSQLVKQVKYQSLIRKRKLLDKQIENKPLHVIIDSNIQKELPTSGIEKRPQQKEIVPRVVGEAVQQAENQRKKIINGQQDKEIQDEDQQDENLEDEEQQEVQRKLRFEDFNGIIPNRKHDQLAVYVYNKRNDFGILENGEIYANKNNKLYSTVKGSNYLDVIDYLSGRINISKEKKSISSILIKRLFKDPNVKDLISQEGRGNKPSSAKPRYIIDSRKKYIKNKQTIGLTRKFRPRLWTKIPI